MLEENVSKTLEYLAEAFGYLQQLNIDGSGLEKVAEYFQSLPKHITKSDVFIKADSIDYSTRYEDIQWIFTNDITYIDFEHPKEYIRKYFDASSELGEYIKKIILDDYIGERESLVVLLSLFESYLHAKVDFGYGTGIKTKFCCAVKKDDKYAVETFSLAIAYAIVKIVFTATDGKQFDRRLPHRNYILHNGTLSYSDDEIKMAYTLLVCFICIIDDLIK